MEISSCTIPGVTERYGRLSHSPTSGADDKIRSRILEDKVSLVTLVTIWWVLQCQVSKVAGQSLPFTAASTPTSDNALTPVDGPEVAQVGETPQQSAPSTPADQLLQFQEVVSSLQFHNYSIGAQYLSDYVFLFPLGSTVFVPTNAAFNALNPSPYLGTVLAYHTILQQLSYQQITLLPVGSRFITMIINNTIVVTSTAPDELRVDNVRIVEGNVCSSSTVALQTTCHGVDGILNMTEWGRATLAHFAPIPWPIPDDPMPELAPTTMLPPESAASTPVPTGGVSSSGGAFCVQRRRTLFLVVSVYVFVAAFVFKTV